MEKLLESLSSAQNDSETYTEDAQKSTEKDQKMDFSQSLITKKISLQDVLMRQLGMTITTAEEFAIGEEIIGNIDENGYLKTTLEEISAALNVSVDKAGQMLKTVQSFEPAGVGARNLTECLIIQLDLAKEADPLLREIIKNHLDDVAKKNLARISKDLKEPLEKIQSVVEKISRLNPKPGRNYSVDEIQQVIPDVIIEENEDEKQLNIIINDENIPRLMISKAYREMLKKKDLDEKTREFIINKLHRAQELLRAMTKRQSTLRRVMLTIVEIQGQAIRENLSLLKPLTFKDVAQKINMHETTVCRVVMNKYCQTPCGVIALKDFFPSKIESKDQNGESVSSEYVKGLIQDLIEEEDKSRPLSDEYISHLLKEKKDLTVARRTVAKYREELKILSSAYRRER
jgi:RNA polymerase sigma-54 factor